MFVTESAVDANKSNRRRIYFFISLSLFIALSVLTVFLGAYFYITTKANNTVDIFTQKATIASLSASTIKLKLDTLGKIAESFANQKGTVGTDIRFDRWDTAIKTLEDLSNDSAFYDPFIDRILLIDENGIIKSAYPNLYGSVGQKALTFNEWEGALLKEKGDFYVTNVYRRIGVPRINVIGVVAPVKVGSSFFGYVFLQVPINNFSDFGKDVDVGNNGLVYFFDRLGHIVSHPRYSSHGPILDFSQVPSVNKVLHKEAGVEVSYNPLEGRELVTAYESVKKYDWGVVVQEPTVDAFADMNYLLFEIILLTVLICLLESFIILFIWGIMNKLKKNEK